MDKGAIPDISADIAGALDWWRDAGVDCAFQDEPVRWIEPDDTPEPEAMEADAAKAQGNAVREETAAVKPSPATDPASWPQDLSHFANWWLSEPSLAEGSTAARVSPRGDAEAELMVVVPEPEREDRDRLLTGPQGRLLEAMLTAMGLAQQKVYFASVLPRQMPGADWGELSASGMGELLVHHIRLVRPKRLAVFGTNILPLIGNGPPQGPADLRIFNHEGSSTPMLAARSLAALLEQPGWKARVWRAWLDWTG